MYPIPFRLSNKVLYPKKQNYSANITEVKPLPIWTDNEQCVSCWKMSWIERIKALIFGRVWIAVLSGSTQPAICAIATKDYLQEVEVDE